MSHDHFAAVREKADLLSLVEELTGSKVKSRTPTDVRFIPCPFCGSKTGFSVNPQTKTYCCHHAGCEEKGDVFTFIKRAKGLARNWDALKFLAERVGYKLPEARPLADERLGQVLALAQEVKRIAAEYYSARLWACRDESFTYTHDEEEHTTTVLGYQTETRGHSEGVLKYMRVGWADGKLLAHLKERYRERSDRKLAFAAMIASGLVRKEKGGRGFHDLFCPRGYIYPVFDGDKVVTFTAKYPDDGIANYQVPRAVEINGQEISVWGADFYFLNQDSLGAEDLVVVEGENDLLSVMDLGGHAEVCGLRGTPNEEQLGALGQRRRGKRTFLCLDNDVPGKDMTRQVAQAVAGPDYDVRVVAVPAEHQDIDDALRATGREKAAVFFQELLANAKPTTDYLLDDLKAAPEERKSGYAEELARIVLKYPPLEQENLRKRMADALGAGARTVQKIFARVRKKEAKPGAAPWREPKEPATPLTSEKLCFRWGPRGLERVEIGEVEGQRVERSEPVANFIIRIEREAQLIDDISNEKRYECRVLMRDDGLDSPGRPFTVDAGHFGTGYRLSDALSAAGFYYAHCSAKDMDFLRMASGRYSEEKGVLHVKTVRYIGYATGPDKEDLGYVSPSVVVRDGKVIPAAEALAKDGLRCEMPTGAFKGVKHLDLAVITDEEFRADLKHIVEELCHLNDVQVSRCCLGQTFLAPVFSRLKGFKPYALTILGDSGHGKTTLATFFQSFFGPGFNEIELESWKSTPLAIERAGHVHKDALYLVDDFKMAHFTTLAKLKEALRILQGYADGAGRNRLTRSSKMMASTFIRGTLMMTGEDFPEGETSNLARLLPVHAVKREVDDELVELRDRCIAMRPLHAGVMARYIAWTQQKGVPYLQERADEIFKGFITDPKVASVVADNKTRILQNLALNCLGFVLWAEFAGEAGAFDETAAQRMVDEHYAFLLSVFRKHVTTVSDERPFVLFLREVRAMRDSEVVRLAPVMEKPGGGFLLDKELKGGNRPLVGYQDDRHVYLLHNAVFKEVGEYRARGRIPAGEFSKRTIVRQLLDNGVLVPNPSRSGTNDERKHLIFVEGEPKRVLKIDRAKLEELGG